MPNSLIHETSPYLLQHAHQPVQWLPYSESVFEKALSENKPILISIGYSTCHWCHVMAHECFEDIHIAKRMNEYLICIKVDREELPDIDKYYISGLQVLTGQGGWPLNVFVLPNKKMFYGVTYLPPKQWQELIEKIYHLYLNEKKKLYEYAEDIHQRIKQFEQIGLHRPSSIYSNEFQKLNETIQQWRSLFDTEWGGHKYLPKFVMPIHYKFLLLYSFFHKDTEILQHLHTSIQHIVLGGLFDHIGGGFYRYSTDRYWKIPHFEKMLYDNAQLIELLSLYYLQFKNDEIHWILEKTIHSVQRDFLSDEYLFYSAWDADSEGKEGKFYTYTIDELKTILQEEFDEFAHIFNIHNGFGHWENNHYLLTIHIPLFQQKRKYWMHKINQWTEPLFAYRKKRIPPSIDTKVITSWNALMIKSLCIASAVLNKSEYLELAQKCMKTLLNKVYTNQMLYRIYHQQLAKIPAYLDDYAFLIDALIQLAKHTGHTSYLTLADALTEQAIQNFYVPVQEVFYYTSFQHAIQNTVELYDDVIPSANAQMMINLQYLSLLKHQPEYQSIAEKIFQKTSPLFYSHPHHAASYGLLLLKKQYYESTEITITGKEAAAFFQKIFPQSWFLNAIYTSNNSCHYSVFQNRVHPQKTFIYVCRHSACYEALESPDMFDIWPYLDH